MAQQSTEKFADWSMVPSIKVEGTHAIMEDPPFSEVLKLWGGATGVSEQFLKISGSVLGGSNMLGLENNISFVSTGDVNAAHEKATELGETNKVKLVYPHAHIPPPDTKCYIGYDCVSQKLIMSTPEIPGTQTVQETVNSILGRPLHSIEHIVFEAKHAPGDTDKIAVRKLHLVVSDNMRLSNVDSCEYQRIGYRVVSISPSGLQAFK